MADDTRQRILDAAFAEFSANGKAGARMQAIAERAQINQAMLNYYFNSKDELYAAVLQRSVEECCHELEPGELKDEQSVQKTWLDHMERDLRFWAEHREVLHLIIHDLLVGGEGMKMAIRQWLESPQSREISEQVSSGRVFREQDARQLVLHFLSLTVLNFLLVPVVNDIWPRREDEPDWLEARIESVKDLIQHGLFVK
ncbi:TetR/AcrR family transcriptional regulator [bacterium]|nr:TetR/AcrR family transcriptional regulator [bacterium]MBU1982778.1 TetR/AcrR family transcriptional regulator [bacterium]